MMNTLMSAHALYTAETAHSTAATGAKKGYSVETFFRTIFVEKESHNGTDSECFPCGCPSAQENLYPLALLFAYCIWDDHAVLFASSARIRESCGTNSRIMPK